MTVVDLSGLGDFDLPHTRWFVWQGGNRLEQIALLYSEPSIPRADRDLGRAQRTMESPSGR